MLKKIVAAVKSLGPATTVHIVVVGVAAVAGAVVAITHPSTFSFHDYETELLGLAGATGVLALGRGIHLNGVARGFSSFLTEAQPIASGLVGESLGSKAESEFGAILKDVQAGLARLETAVTNAPAAPAATAAPAADPPAPAAS